MKKRIIKICIGICLILIGFSVLFKDLYGSSVDETAKSIAVNVVATKINQTLNEGIYNEELSGSILDIQKNNEGAIQYLEANSRLINKLVLSFSMKMDEKYSLGDITVVPVNLGVLTGSRVLSEMPFNVKIKVMPLSMTKFQCETEFVTEGINQTRYKVYCQVTSRVQILAPFSRKTAEINRKVLLAEAIIVGKVPDSYVFVPEDNILDVAGS